MLPIVSTLCLLLSLAAASPSANQYVQNVMSTAYPREVRNLRLEPAVLHDFSTYFGKPGAFVPTGRANFTNGILKGLSIARPYYECVGPKLYRGELTVNCTISLSSLQTSYNGLVKNGTSPVYSVKATANLTDTLIYLVIAGQSPYYYGSVKFFQINRIAGIVPRITGLPSTLQQYASVMANSYTSNVYPQLLDILRQSFVYALNRALATIPMPRQ